MCSVKTAAARTAFYDIVVRKSEGEFCHASRQTKAARRGWARIAVVSGGLAILFAASFPGVGSDQPASNMAASPTKANYELAARWTSSKVAKLVFDMAVTPHWLADGNRFWYTYENSTGRKFYVVDPTKKTKTYVFDAVKLAASMTMATGLPYDSQHLPITTIRYVKGDNSIEFELNVPRDAIIPGEKKGAAVTATEANQQDPDADDDSDSDPQQQGGRGGAGGAAAPGRNQKQLAFEYELTTGKLTLLDERPARKPNWANVSPDGKTIVFGRYHNLFLMDDVNYAKALKSATDTTIVETQLTKDGEEFSAMAAAAVAADSSRISSNSSRTTTAEILHRTRRKRRGRGRLCR